MDSINMTEFRTLPTESTSDLHLSEESMNLLEVPQLDSCTHMEGLPEIPAKLVSYWFYSISCFVCMFSVAKPCFLND